MIKSRAMLLGLMLNVCAQGGQAADQDAVAGPKPLMRVGAAQPRSRLIDHRLAKPEEVLARVDRTLDELAQIVRKAGAAKCDALALPEDTLGLGTWEAANKRALKEVLPEAVKRMLDRLGQAAAAQHMYLT